MAASSSELVKLYYRIGEVASIVGVQPHVLRYWETEFRTIRPQKSHKGQRVYSRRDVEKLLRVKDLLKNQGFTIAGAKRKLREPEPASAREPGPQEPSSPAEAARPLPSISALRQDEPVGRSGDRDALPAGSVPAAGTRMSDVDVGDAPGASGRPLLVAVTPAAAEVRPPAGATAAARSRPAVDAARMRHALLTLREDIVAMIGDLERAPRRPKLPATP